jgi:hypothetical protein
VRISDERAVRIVGLTQLKHRFKDLRAMRLDRPVAPLCSDPACRLE